MRIREIEIKHFRSIVDPLRIENVADYVTLSGPNNAGKSNVLRALDLYFNDWGEPNKFVPSLDRPASIGPKAQTRIVVTFGLQDSSLDDRVREQLAAYTAELGIEPAELKVGPSEEEGLRIGLMYYPLGAKRFDFAAKGIGIRGTQRDRTDEFADFVRKLVDFRYIPAPRDPRQTFNVELIEEVKEAIFYRWGRGPTRARQLKDRRERFDNITQDLLSVLGESGGSIAEMLGRQFEDIRDFRFDVPHRRLEEFLGQLDIVIDDGSETSLSAKGSSVQSSVFLFLLRFLSKFPRPYYEAREHIWAIEEPELSLHPEAQRRLREVLKEFSKDCQIFITTHSPLLLDREHPEANILLESEVVKPGTAHEYVRTIRRGAVGKDRWKPFREALGVLVSDSMLFGDYNVIVEGPADAMLLEGVSESMMTRGIPGHLDLRTTEVIPAGSASEAVYFFTLLSTWSPESKEVVLFDHDDEGKRAAERMKKKGFALGKDYLYISIQTENDVDLLDLASERVKDLARQSGHFTIKTTDEYPDGNKEISQRWANKPDLARFILENPSLKNSVLTKS